MSAVDVIGVVYRDRVLVAHVGHRGPPGAPGDAASVGLVVELVAAEDVSGQRVITVDATGKAIYADRDNVAHADVFLAVTTGAALTDEAVQARVSGVMSEPGWSWDTTRAIWLDTEGQLTQTPPTSGHATQIATPVTPTSINVHVQPSIIL